jgi:hypothetical protein
MTRHGLNSRPSNRGARQSGAGFDPELSDAARNDVGVRLIGLDALYG